MTHNAFKYQIAKFTVNRQKWTFIQLIMQSIDLYMFNTICSIFYNKKTHNTVKNFTTSIFTNSHVYTSIISSSLYISNRFVNMSNVKLKFVPRKISLKLLNTYFQVSSISENLRTPFYCPLYDFTYILQTSFETLIAAILKRI